MWYLFDTDRNKYLGQYQSLQDVDQHLANDLGWSIDGFVGFYGDNSFALDDGDGDPSILLVNDKDKDLLNEQVSTCLRENEEVRLATELQSLAAKAPKRRKRQKRQSKG